MILQSSLLPFCWLIFELVLLESPSQKMQNSVFHQKWRIQSDTIQFVFWLVVEVYQDFCQQIKVAPKLKCINEDIAMTHFEEKKGGILHKKERQ